MLRCVCGMILRQSIAIDSHSNKLLSCGFKSKISLDNLYPKNEQMFKDVKSPSATTEESFSGVIPIKEIDIQCCRSSGPGGQHVNKVNTKVEMRFNVDAATWIPDWIKPKLKEQQESRINKVGELIVRSEKTRKQFLNQADCLEKIRNMIFTASIKPKELTPEQIALQKKREDQANLKRVADKRRRSLLKSVRRSAP